jgi:hypothetical protein
MRERERERHTDRDRERRPAEPAREEARGALDNDANFESAVSNVDTDPGARYDRDGNPADHEEPRRSER